MVKFASAVAVALFLCGCGAGTQKAPVRAHPAHRVVSIVPSLTEDLCAIGARKDLVAVSQFSDDIPCAARLPRVSNYSSVDAEKIVALHPDVVVALPAERAMLQPLVRAGIPALTLRDDSYSDLFFDIRSLGAVTGRNEAARSLISALERRTAQLRAGEHFAHRPSVFVVLQAQPVWTAGGSSYISTLISLAGGRNAAAGMNAAYAQYSAEALVNLQPEAIIAGSDTHIASALASQPWRSLTAVKSGNVFIYRPALLDRPGPHYNEGISWLIERLRPLSK